MTMKTFLTTVLAIGQLAALPTLAHAEGIFGGGTKLDPAFCQAHNIRQTVVYIDDSILVTGNTAWATTLYGKLKATLVPGERTTLVELSPATGQSSELWTGCWPAYTAEKAAKLAQQSHFFSGSPLDALKDQQGFFFRDFGINANKIAKKGDRSQAAVSIDAASPPQKSIIRALASDGARYAHAHETVRAILYSDLAENSDLGSVFKAPSAPPTDYGARLGTYLRRSVFYVFGVGTDIKDDSHVQDNIRLFWTDAFRSMAANVGGMGSDLNVPNVLPVTEQSYDLHLEDEGQNLTGHLSLLSDSEGALVDSWIGITRLRNATINGTLHCDPSGAATNCTLQATTSGGVVTTSPTEAISLTSHGENAMAGTIGVQGSNVNLKLSATLVQ